MPDEPIRISSATWAGDPPEPEQLPDEPIRVSSTAWTGPPAEIRPEPEPEPKPEPLSLGQALALSAGGIGLFAAVILNMLATGSVRTRHWGTVTATANPGEFNFHGMMALAMFLFSCIVFVVCLRIAWRRRRDRAPGPLFQPATDPDRPDETDS